MPQTIQIDGLEQIAKGLTAKIFQIDDEQVIKVFFGIFQDDIEAISNQGLEQLLKRIREAKVPVPEPSEIVSVLSDSQNFYSQGVLMPYLKDLQSLGEDIFGPDYNEETYSTLATFVGRLHGAGIVIAPSHRNKLSHAQGQLFAVFKKAPTGIIAIDWSNLALVEWLVSKDDPRYHSRWMEMMVGDLSLPLNFGPLDDHGDYLSNEYFNGFIETCPDQEIGREYHKHLKKANIFFIRYNRPSYEG